MPELIALGLDPGTGFIAALQRVWAAGDAVLPVDQRLPRPAVRALFDALRPDAIIGAGGDRQRLDRGPAHGRPTTRGPVVASLEDGDALVVATSGTTGRPKGVILTHDAVLASAVATSSRLEVDAERDCWLSCLPLAHIGGLAVVTRALATGVPLVVHERFEPHRVERAAQDGATLVSLVATALRRTDVSGFRTVLLGGAAPPDSLPPNVVTTYGMTETGSGVVYDGVALDTVDVRVVGSEIQVRGPMLLRTYRDGTDPRLAGGWLPTGDAGRIEEGGRLSVLGRVDDAIVTGGENVWPGPVELVLDSHPGVEEVAVWKRPDPEWGERVVAWVVPSDPADPPKLEELRQLVSAQVAPWAAPRELVISASLSRTPSGKVLRSRLR